jgi:adenosine kinase
MDGWMERREERSACHVMSLTSLPQEHMPLYAELARDFKVDYVAGGSALNTMRTAAWFAGEASARFGYFGSVGQDANADILLKAAAASGVFMHTSTTSEKPTGTCAVLVTGHERSLVANIAAAEKFDINLLSDATATAALAGAKAIYVTGFFLTHSPDAALRLAKMAAERNIAFVMNISAPFLVFVPAFRERVLALLEYADYVFCNHLEAGALGQAMGWGDDLVAVARKTAALPKANGARSRRVIFTHGGEPAILVGGDSTEVRRFAPIALGDKELVDENGAGDAYVGGFLAALVRDKPLEECFASAAYCAWVVIRRVGCTFPDTKEPKEHQGVKFFVNN